MMRQCLTDLAGRFSTHRMVREYAERAYIPAHRAFAALSRDAAAPAKDLTRWRSRVASAWPSLSVETTLVPVQSLVKAGDKYPIQARVKLGTLTPDDVLVEVIHGLAAGEHEIVSPTATAMRLVESAGGFASYSADIIATQSGRYAFSVRALPKHKHLSYRFLSPPLITWEP
jgi:starch phosphorylase